MTKDVVISVERIAKKYRIEHQGQRQEYVALRDVIAHKTSAPFRWLRGRAQTSNLPTSTSARASYEEFWALREVSFEVKQGEVVGIIGRNGAGKSTLLKLLSRITEPTEGRVSIKGRVASLLEVGTGFHPELTGRENIFLNGSILGMRRVEIDKKFDEIVAFAEVDRFLDTPVKRYSSGMYVRLAFAVAAHLEPEILIVDEVLAVGDAQFQNKCLGKMSAVAKQGRTVLFVSHNMGVISTLTQRCLCFQNGQIVASGTSRDVVELYLRKSNEVQMELEDNLESYRRDKNTDSPVRIIGIHVNDSRSAANVLPTIELGNGFKIEVHLDVSKSLHGANMDLVLKNSYGQPAAVLFSWDDDFALSFEPGRHKVIASVKNLPLAPGQYFLDMGINQSVQSRAFDVIVDFPLFRVVNNGRVTHWLDRPWGILHCFDVEWQTTSES